MISIILVILSATAGILAIISVLFSWIFARLWCMPKRKEPDKLPSDFNLPYESIIIQSKGINLSGWFIPSRKKTMNSL